MIDFTEVPERKPAAFKKRQSPKKRPSEKDLRYLYLYKEESTTTIGEYYNVKPMTVVSWLHHYNIPVKE